MDARRTTVLALVLGLALLLPGFAARGAQDSTPTPGDYEVWIIDQSNTTSDGGGTLVIYPGAELANGAGADAPEVIDLAGDATTLCAEQTGDVPVRPHMILFNETHTHAIISFVATGHVLFVDAASRAPVTCIDVGEQAHAAFPAPDESTVIVANQNGKLLQRITTDYATTTFTLDDEATLDLATCTTPSGGACEDEVLRPDNAPICPIIDSSSRYAFVTLRGGGLLVTDITTTPMAIVAEYDAATVGPNGCGGLEAQGKIYLNSGGGTPLTPFAADLYAFPIAEYTAEPAPPNTPAPTHVFSYGDLEADSHGATLTNDGAYLWVADRAADLIVVVDTTTDEVVNEIALRGDLSDRPAPDLLDVSPDGQWVFAALRGPNPLTANNPDVNNAVGSTPGLGVIQVADDGRSGELIAVHAITNLVEGAEAADPHGLRVRHLD